MKYSIEDICNIIDGQLTKQSDSEATIYHPLIDSRKLLFPKHTLFFAIPGDHFDGHQYISDLAERGVENFVVSRSDVSVPNGVNCIHVEDTITALQLLAKHHRNQFAFPIIGITGSNGKTIVKEWLHHLLNTSYDIVRSPKSYNSQIGVPLSTLLIEADHNLGIFEAGISEPDEMEKLAAVIQPNIGIFTNIGEAHNEGFINHEHKTAEKLKLFLNSDVLIYSKDHQDINGVISKFRQQFAGKAEDSLNVLSWSLKSDADVRYKMLETTDQGSKISCNHDGQSFEFTTPYSDYASVENLLHCITVMLYLQVDPGKIIARIPSLQQVAMRLELKEGLNNCSIINDSYNSDINSLQIAVDFLNQQHTHSKKTVILSDLLQSGLPEQVLYGQVAELLRSFKLDRFIGIGPAIERQKAQFESLSETQVSCYPDVSSFMEEMSTDQFQDESILIKGARVFRLERISQLIESKAHQTVLEIDLPAIIHNYRTYQSGLEKGTKVMVMVKAFSYGSGSYEIAKVLEYIKADYLAVAYADEGIALRKSGIQLPIVVMNTEPRSYEAIIHHQLEPVIYNFKTLRDFHHVLNTFHGESDIRFPIHIKFDSGMHRLGFQTEDLNSLCNNLVASENSYVKSVFTHLVASDDESHDDYTILQVECFQQACETLSQHLHYPFLKHCLNSAGITRFPKYQMDMVRLGLGLYGIDTSDDISNQLKPVGTLKTIISQIKHIQKGETVGYSRKGIVERDSKVATIAIGYADGIPRSLGNGNISFVVNGTPVPTIGNICMDMTMLDVTDANAKEGDVVIVFGKENPVQKLADGHNTIVYEILSGISNRVQRVYFQGDM